MRRRLPVPLVLAGLALLAAGSAAAANGGFTPPTPHSPGAHRITDVYYVILGVTGAIFVLVETALLLFVFRFRSRGRARSVEGPQIRGHARLELAWTVAPIVILAAIAAFVFYKLPGIKNTPPASAAEQRLNVRIDAHQFYWQFTYPNGAVSIDRMIVPYGSVVALDVHSEDVAHSWWIPALGGKIDAIPGRTNHTWFRASRVGTFRGQCAEFCGIQHAAMLADVSVVPASTYARTVATLQKGTPETLGAQEFVGVCAKCHGGNAQGDIGPPLVGNALLSNPTGLTSIIVAGRGRMPAVGKGWSAEQLRVLIAYLRSHYGGG